MTDLAHLASALADRYRIERELGAGGMATVYLAENLKHHRNVAVNVLKPELAAVLGASCREAPPPPYAHHHGVIRRDNQAGSGAGRDGHGPGRAG
jgi:hypothetical protein